MTLTDHVVKLLRCVYFLAEAIAEHQLCTVCEELMCAELMAWVRLQAGQLRSIGGGSPTSPSGDLDDQSGSSWGLGSILVAS